MGHILHTHTHTHVAKLVVRKAAESLCMCMCLSVCTPTRSPNDRNDHDQTWHGYVDRSGNGSVLKKRFHVWPGMGAHWANLRSGYLGGVNKAFDL